MGGKRWRQGIVTVCSGGIFVSSGIEAQSRNHEAAYSTRHNQHARAAPHCVPPSNALHCVLQLEDIAFLKELARTNKRKLTSMERYERDLAARKFEWSATHEKRFWEENATRFEADGFRLIEGVRDLLQDPDGLVDETTQAVALSDLGEFAVAHPQGRTCVR